VKETDEVLLFNERGEVTEACNYNLVAEIDGELLTPPVHCGLLAGTFREELMANGEIKEGIITLAALKRSQRLFLVNSVRRWRKAILIE
jgi:para-aminobenzoate synthetase/4-amino-4-deoxychorismate lyase